MAELSPKAAQAVPSVFLDACSRGVAMGSRGELAGAATPRGAADALRLHGQER